MVALIAGMMLYSAGKVVGARAFANWIEALERGTEVKSTMQDMPICTTMAAMGSEADWAQLDPDLKAGKKALAAGDWNGAITALNLTALRDPRNADIHNYIGYAYRRMRQLGPAMGHYQQRSLSTPVTAARVSTWANSF